METTKKVTITLKKSTIKRLDAFVLSNSINKSALMDRLVNEEIDKKTK
jgi:hypothetical protein